MKRNQLKQHKPVGTKNKNRKKRMKHTLVVTPWVWLNAVFVYKNLLYLIWQWLFSQLAPLKHKELFLTVSPVF